MERSPNRLQPYFGHTRTGKIGLAVENDVRMAIHEAEQGEKYLSLNALAGYRLFPEDKDMMTPKEFIAIMSECIDNETLRESLLNKSAN